MFLSKSSVFDYEIRTKAGFPSYFYFYILDGAKVAKTYQFARSMPRDVFTQMLDYCDAHGFDYMYLPSIPAFLPVGDYQLDLFAPVDKPWTPYLLSEEKL